MRQMQQLILRTSNDGFLQSVQVHVFGELNSVYAASQNVPKYIHLRVEYYSYLKLGLKDGVRASAH